MLTLAWIRAAHELKTVFDFDTVLHASACVEKALRGMAWVAARPGGSSKRSSLEAKGQGVGGKQARVQGLVSFDGAATTEARVRQAEGHAGGGIGGAPQLQAAGYGWGGGGREEVRCLASRCPSLGESYSPL